MLNSTWVLGLAALLAAALFGIYLSGFYIFILWVLGASFILAGAVVFSVMRSHCHSRILGLLLGAAAATIMYAGFYYFCMASSRQWRNWDRFDELPGYVAEFMRTNRAQGGLNAWRPAPADSGEMNKVVVNWSLASIEGLMALSICMYAGWLISGFPYCRRHRLWMQHQAFSLAPGSGVIVKQGLNVRSFATLMNRSPISDRTDGATKVVLNYCLQRKPGAGNAEIDPACPVLLTVTEGRKSILRRVILSAHERSLLSFHSNAEEVPLEANQEEESEKGAEMLSSARERRPQFGILRVDSPYTGQVLAGRTIAAAFAYRMLPMLLLPPAIYLFFTGTGNWDSARNAAAVGNAEDFRMAVEGTALILVSVLLFFTHCQTGQGRFLKIVADREIRKRSDACVLPDDPKAIFVKNVPAKSKPFWSIEDAADAGYLKVDVRLGLLLFEGDRWRWQVPIDRLVEIDTEEVKVAYGQDIKFRLRCLYLGIQYDSGDRRVQGRFLPYALGRADGRRRIESLAESLREIRSAALNAKRLEKGEGERFSG